MALLTVQDVPAVGIDNIAFTAATASDTAPSGGNHVLVVKNAGAGATTVTITTPGTVDGLAIADIVRTVPLTTGLGVIPLIGRLVGATATIVASPITSVSLAVLKLAK